MMVKELEVGDYFRYHGLIYQRIDNNLIWDLTNRVSRTMLYCGVDEVTKVKPTFTDISETRLAHLPDGTQFIYRDKKYTLKRAFLHEGINRAAIAYPCGPSNNPEIFSLDTIVEPFKKQEYCQEIKFSKLMVGDNFKFNVDSPDFYKKISQNSAISESAVKEVEDSNRKVYRV